MNRLQQQITEELGEEISRDHWLAMSAAEQFLADGGPEDLDDEPLSCLIEWLRQEQMDRDNRRPEYVQELPF